MTPRQSRALKEAHTVLRSYLPAVGTGSMCVAEIKARISEILERAEACDGSRSNDAVVDLLRSVRAELARNFADAEAPPPRSGRQAH